MNVRDPSPRRWPAFQGEVAALMREEGWSSTELGPPSAWPANLRSVVGMMLPAHVQIVLFWGPRYVAFYNDVYAPTIGNKHPAALGRPAIEHWTELWDDLEPLLAQVRSTGETLSARDRPFRIERHGYLETVYFDISYSAVTGEDGGVDGVLCLVNETTERVRGEAALRNAETARQAEAERIQLALNAGAVIGTWVWDVTLDRFTADSSFARTFAIDATALKEGMPIERVKQTIHPDDLPDVNVLLAEALARGGRYRAEYRVPGPDGAWMWIEANGHVELDGAGRPLRFPGVLIDLTARRQAAETQDQFRLAQVAAGLGVFSLDIATDVLAVSPEFCRLFGLPVSPTLPASRMEALQLDEPGSSMSDAAHRAQGLSAVETEYCIRRPDDGETVWLARRAEYVRDAQGRVTAMRGVVQDITKRKRAEAALRAHQSELARLNASLEERVARRTRDLDRVWRLSTDLMIVTHLDGRIEAVNPAWRTQLGWEPSEMVGRPFLELVHPDDHGVSEQETARLRTGLTTLRFENRWRHRDGTYRTVAWTAVPEGGFVHAVGRDVTAERAAAEALHEAEARLRQSQKMEAVGQLTGGIAHDFNNLLQGISGSLEVVRKRIAQGRATEVERHVDAALGATQKAASLTHRLLAFSRRQPLDPKPVRPNPLVGSMEDLLRRTLGEHIALEMVLAEGVWTTLCDPNQLESALLNLAINARDAMPDGGTLEIETRNLVLHAGAAAPPGEYVCIAVSDTGTGMPPDVVARAFDPFFTTKPIGQGTGLGLSMIYGFALQSEGFCHIDSAEGRGTTVTLSLPRHHGPDTREADTPVDAACRAERGEVVLVVEDEPIVRGLIVDLLGERGYRVLTATDGLAGLARLQEPDPIDLLLTDIGLPGLDGRRLAEAARIVRPGLKVLFMTGYANDAATAHGFLDTGMGIVTKPFTMDHLAVRVRELLATGHA